MKKLVIIIFALLFLMSCAAMPEESTVHDTSNATENTKEEKPSETPEEQKDPFEESPLSLVSVTVESPTKDLQGTWVMYPGGNVPDNVLVVFDRTKANYKAAYENKEGELLTSVVYLDGDKITQLYISGLANYTFLKHQWNSTGTLSIYYTDKNTGKETAHSLRKYSDSFLDEGAYEDISSIHGLWVNEDKTKGLRFLPDGILWVYSGIDSEKCKWKDSDGNSIAVLDSFGFSEKVPFARIGDNLLVYDGEKYYKAD